MNAENIIREHDSGRRPFTTPDGYFESFTQKLMQRLPEQTPEQTPAQTPPRVVPLRPMQRLMRYAATVAVAVMCLGGGIYIYNHHGTSATTTASADDIIDDDSNLEEILDYEMLSNNQIAYYLTEAY